MKRTVGELMRQRDLSNFPFVYHDASIEDALIALEKFDSGAVAVMNGESIVGVFSERDFVRTSVYSQGAMDLKRQVSDLMTSNVIYVTPKYRLEECLALMSQLRVRHLPVIQNDIVIALLSMSHIMEALIEDREFVIEQLTKYVTGSPVIDQRKPPEILIKNYSNNHWGY